VAVQVPPGLRIRDGVEKWVLREAMKHVLPRALYERQKFAFMAPPSHTDAKKRGAIVSLVEQYLSRDAIEALGHFDSARVQSFLSEAEEETDPVRAVRNDALLNQLLGIHIVHGELASNAPRRSQSPHTIPTPNEVTMEIE
jgi:asparagine synthase (glutamine-hydrolysing)